MIFATANMGEYEGDSPHSQWTLSATLGAMENKGYILPSSNRINTITKIKPIPPLGP